MLAPWKKSYGKPRHCIKEQRHHLANKDLYSESYGFSSSHVWMWELNYKESWALKNWCFQTVILETTLGSPLDSKEIKQVKPKGGQSWIFIGKTCWSWSASTLATWCEKSTNWKRPWCWERLKAGEEGNVRGQDGWTALPIQCTWVWASAGSWWTEKPYVLQSMGLQSQTLLNNKNNILKKFFLNLFGCTGSALLYTGFFYLWFLGFSLWWPLLLWSTGSRNTGFSSSNRWA